MRVYGRPVTVVDGKRVNGPWQLVETDANGFNTSVSITALAQYLKLNLNESPIYGSAGIPGRQSVKTQVPPDVYVALAQQRFAGQFASLTVAREAGAQNPTYLINALALDGSVLNESVPAPQ